MMRIVRFFFPPFCFPHSRNRLFTEVSYQLGVRAFSANSFFFFFESVASGNFFFFLPNEKGEKRAKDLKGGGGGTGKRTSRVWK